MITQGFTLVFRSLIQIVFAESDKVNLSKINPMYVAQTLND